MYDTTTKPQFIFTKYTNSFSVHISNLEQLSVEQIQVIQSFVSKRKGLFDFGTYSFVIQKRLEFTEFISLLKFSEIDADVKEIVLQTKTEPRVGFGQYKGMYYSEIPDSYLLWLRGNYRGKDRDIIDSELKSRKL